VRTSSLDLRQHQIEREADAAEYGLAGWDDVPFLRETLGPLSSRISLKKQDIINGTSRKLEKYAIPLLCLVPEKLALVTVAILIQGCPATFTELAFRIGRRCRLERHFDVARERARDVCKLLEGRNKNPWNNRTRARKLADSIDEKHWLDGDRRGLHLGVFLIEQALEHSRFSGNQVFRLQKATKKKGRRKPRPAMVVLRRQAKQWLNENGIPTQLVGLRHLPMVVEPNAWEGLHGCPYLVEPERNLIKPSKGVSASEPMPSGDFRTVCAAVNALQETPWRINQAVYSIFRRAWDEKLNIPGLGPYKRERLPPRLPATADAVSAKARRAERSRIYRANKGIDPRQTLLSLRLAQCDELAREERFYFPYELDHRGRVYPIAQILHPQADDLGKALLEFADGKGMGDRGAFWLAVHLAGCYGINKASYAEREKWTIDHQEEICDSALKPLDGIGFWMQTDEKPWCFLAACKEWQRYREPPTGLSSKSHLPISMDGTCNGYQHLSAMGRDPIGAAFVNLIPADKPDDMYGRVAAEVNRRLQQQPDNPWGTGLVPRRMVKPATMTTPYGVTQKGMCRQLHDEFVDDWAAAKYLAGVLEECVAEVAGEAVAIKNWLRSVAEAMAVMNKGLSWTLPTGFVAVHDYREERPFRISTAERTLTIRVKGDKLNVEKQLNAIAANFVHSYDAAHMMMTVCRLHDKGLRHFAMVHDSYGVHACDVEMMHGVLREEFVRIYRKDVLTEFLKEQDIADPTFRPPTPPVPELDIESVLASDYFFA
jgi:DNA-directed RNA polymerase